MQKQEEYRKYIEEHRKFVKQAFENLLKSNILQLDAGDLEQLRIEIENHDMSKYDEEEFEPYRKHFYPCSFENANDTKAEFDKAKEHHFLANNHHPQHPDRKIKVDRISVVHNILDWIAMSYKFGDYVWDFYEQSKIGEQFSSKEKEMVENIILLIKKKKDIFYPEKSIEI